MAHNSPAIMSEISLQPVSYTVPITFSLDIGGSLVKLVHRRTFRFKRTIPKPSCGPVNDKLSYDYTEHEDEGQRLCFMMFETRNIEDCLDFISREILGKRARSLDGHQQPVKIKVTGGGAYKYRDLICSKLGVDFDKEDEMDCLIRGCVFMLQNIPDELFYYEKHATPACVFVSGCLSNTFPFLLVNIGSGVSILKVESPTSYTRVGGSSFGGGSFWGLGTLLSGGKYGFDELLSLADSGDHRHVDMLVRDIYGGAYETLGLPGDVIASSFGLAARYPQQPRETADIIKALLITVSNNIGQLACLYAKQHNLTRILFGGFFIRGHGLTMEVITYAVRFWSGGAYRALFLRHEGYLGAVGAYLKTFDIQNDTPAKTLWAENYVSCLGVDLIISPRPNEILNSLDQTNTDVTSSCASEDNLKLCNVSDAFTDDLLGVENLEIQKAKTNEKRVMDLEHFQLDRVFASSLELFPILESNGYTPDTWDLTQDKEAREYWLQCLEDGIESHRLKAEESQFGTLSNTTERSKQFAARYVDYLQELNVNPSGRGALSVRCLLSAQQHFLREFGFGDAYCIQKKQENRSALAALPGRLHELAGLDWNARQLALVMGLLGGNMFDWGAAESVKYMKEAPVDKFGMPEFSHTIGKVQSRPWLIDDYDKWIKRLNTDNQSYRCILIFCDNSGADVIMGVLPFAIEFLNRGSKIILAANSSPALNDVTYQELDVLLRMVASFEPTIASALSEGRLLVAENGQTSPCLDFRLIASSLVQLTIREKVDLIVIEGMGRAIHCNLNAKFTVDALKVAVIKNTWLARRLGGNLYSVVFKFEAI